MAKRPNMDEYPSYAFGVYWDSNNGMYKVTRPMWDTGVVVSWDEYKKVTDALETQTKRADKLYENLEESRLNLRHSKEDVVDLQKTNKLLEKQLDSAVNLNEQTSFDLAEAKASNERLYMELAVLKVDNERIVKANQALLQEVDRLKEAFLTAERLMIEENNERWVAQNELSETLTELEQMRSKLRDAEDKLLKDNLDDEAKTPEIGRLNRVIDQLIEDGNKLEEKYKLLHHTVKEKESVIALEQARVKGLSEENVRLREANGQKNVLLMRHDTREFERLCRVVARQALEIDELKELLDK